MMLCDYYLFFKQKCFLFCIQLLLDNFENCVIVSKAHRIDAAAQMLRYSNGITGLHLDAEWVCCKIKSCKNTLQIDIIMQNAHFQNKVKPFRNNLINFPIKLSFQKCLITILFLELFLFIDYNVLEDVKALILFCHLFEHVAFCFVLVIVYAHLNELTVFHNLGMLIRFPPHLKIITIYWCLYYFFENIGLTIKNTTQYSRFNLVFFFVNFNSSFVAKQTESFVNLFDNQTADSESLLISNITDFISYSHYFIFQHNFAI